ncbi:MAG: transketolase [Coriobacteriales bacterium]|nr:transketolase [Coriobacteriales bacterium]
MFNDGFASPLTEDLREALSDRARRARGTVLTATTLANSGHPGGSFSSMELYTTVYSCARLRPDDPGWAERDRVVVSHGHTSPGAYAALAMAGFFSADDLAAHFRQANAIFEGHVERHVPGIEWSTGNLGQGLSAGVGFALASQFTGQPWHTYVMMSDAEQHKGQVAEARRLAVKHGLCDLTAVVDLNGVQISGRTLDIMPVSVASDFEADGWRVIHVDGHDLGEVHEALRSATSSAEGPTAIIARTHMGHPVSFMLDDYDFHGRGLSEEEYAKAMNELGLESDLEVARARRAEGPGTPPVPVASSTLDVRSSASRDYGPEKRTDNRSAWGSALLDIGESNEALPMAVLDCDLAVSVKTDAFRDRWPERFIECGVGEHNAATVAGALSISGVLTFWADFGVFGIDEVYNQQRLNDINAANVKLVVTHCGLDVGEDGRTHHCIDYVGTLRNMFGWKVIVPADPNQTDRAARAMASMPGNVCLAMGRSKIDVVLAADGSPLFAGDYRFRYGEVVWAREGADACVLAMGTVAGAAVKAADVLAADGISVAVGIVACPLALDEDAMARAGAFPAVLTVEDHNVLTGLGACVAESFAEHGKDPRLIRSGVTKYTTSGAARDLLADAGLDAAGIESALREAIGR